MRARAPAPGSIPLLFLTICATAALTACNANLLGSNQPTGANPNSPPDSGKSTPVITWPQPAPITNPAPLTSAQLDASANVAGAFVYSPAAGTVLADGTQTLTATFTPADTAGYNMATASVTIVVNAAVNPVAVGSGHLAVADFENNRVLIYDAPFATGMAASAVLGQPDFDSNAWSSPTPNSLLFPTGLDMDTAGNLLVADSGEERVLRFEPAFANGMDASLEIGQPNLTSPNDCYKSGPPETTLCDPRGVALDSSGDVWVADAGAGRVLEYQASIQQGMSPSLVVGQPNMSDTADCDGGSLEVREVPDGNTNANELCDPGAMQFDQDGDLWVVDAGNGRVLEFVPPFSDGMAATLELGYPASVGMSSPTPAAQGYSCPSDRWGINSSFSCGPEGLAFDVQGNLWVSDFNTVREFVPPFTSGMSASLIIGTPRESNAWVSPTASIMSGVQSIAFDSSGDLIAVDSGDNRVLIFTPPFSAGMSASVVIGQPDMTSSGLNQCTEQDCTDVPAPSARTLWEPWGVAVF